MCLRAIQRTYAQLDLATSKVGLYLLGGQNFSGRAIGRANSYRPQIWYVALLGPPTDTTTRWVSKSNVYIIAPLLLLKDHGVQKSELLVLNPLLRIE